MLETCIQDARLNFGILKTLSGPHLGGTESSRIANQLELHASDAANHDRRNFMPDRSPSQPTPEPHLHRRHSLYAEHGNFQPNSGPFAVTEQASASDSGYMGMTGPGPGQAEGIWLPDQAFQHFEMGRFEESTGIGASHFQIGDPASGNNWNFDFARGEGQEEYHQTQE